MKIFDSIRALIKGSRTGAGTVATSVNSYMPDAELERNIDRQTLHDSGVELFEKRPVTDCKVGGFRSTVMLQGLKSALNSIHFNLVDERERDVDIHNIPALSEYALR